MRSAGSGSTQNTSRQSVGEIHNLRATGHAQRKPGVLQGVVLLQRRRCGFEILITQYRRRGDQRLRCMDSRGSIHAPSPQFSGPGQSINNVSSSTPCTDTVQA